MKRSDFYIRLITVVLFLAVASYIGVSIYNAMINTFVTAPAMSYSVEEAISTQGYVVRTEMVLTDTGAAIMPTVGEGEKVASGQAVAVEYMSREALETAGEIRALRLKVAQLEASGMSAVEEECFDSVMDLSAAVQSGDLSNLDELLLKIETYVFAGSSSPESELPALRERLAALESRIEGVRTIYAPISGTFSQMIDGFEHVGPGALSDATPSKLDEIFSAPSSEHGVGKLVIEFRWYFAAILDSEDASRLTAGRTRVVQFSGAYNESVDMMVESVGRREDGRCVVLFSSDRGIHEVAPLRSLQAEVVTGAISGIRVPKEAIHLDDEAATFVYLQTGARAERVNVEILYEIGDVYLVRDGVETGSPLREGSTIIVKANNIYDGKIVA